MNINSICEGIREEQRQTGKCLRGRIHNIFFFLQQSLTNITDTLFQPDWTVTLKDILLHMFY